MRTLVTMTVLGLAAVGSPVGAQDGFARGGLVAGGIGLAHAGISVGGQSGSASGLTAHARIGATTGRHTLLLLDVELQPFEVQNPARAEAFRSTYVLIALQRYLAPRVYARAGAGLQFRSWTGPNPVTAADNGLALGGAVGAEVPLGGRLVLTPEIVANTAFIEVEGSVNAQLVGIRLSLGAHRHRG
jgi:hypothetical protein